MKHITERGMAPKNLPELEVTTALDRRMSQAGDEVKVTITVNNIGNATARDVAVQTSTPAGVQVTSLDTLLRSRTPSNPGVVDVAACPGGAAMRRCDDVATCEQVRDLKSRVSSELSATERHHQAHEEAGSGPFGRASPADQPAAGGRSTSPSKTRGC